GAVAGCKKWYTVEAGDTCSSAEMAAGVPTGTLQNLNTGLGADCNNLWKGYSYCVG
ncbi:carbohydrate-binding module family 50 protein, partial [Zopfia rhizophila CBS 207.26]